MNNYSFVVVVQNFIKDRQLFNFNGKVNKLLMLLHDWITCTFTYRVLLTPLYL